MAALHKTRHGAFYEIARIAVDVLDELGQRPADDLLERRVNEVRKTAIDGANLAIEGKSEQNIIEGVNQVAIALLRAGDDFEKLVELLVAGRLGIALFQAVHQAAQLGNFRGLLPHEDGKKDDQNDKADGQCQCFGVV